MESVIVTSKTFDNVVYRRTLQDTADRISKGEQFAPALFFGLLGHLWASETSDQYTRLGSLSLPLVGCYKP